MLGMILKLWLPQAREPEWMSQKEATHAGVLPIWPFHPALAPRSTVLLQKLYSQMGLSLSTNFSLLGRGSVAPLWLGCCCQEATYLSVLCPAPQTPTPGLCSHLPKLHRPSSCSAVLAFAVGTLPSAGWSPCRLLPPLLPPGDRAEVQCAHSPAVLPCFVSEGKSQARKILKIIIITTNI